MALWANPTESFFLFGAKEEDAISDFYVPSLAWRMARLIDFVRSSNWADNGVTVGEFSLAECNI